MGGSDDFSRLGATDPTPLRCGASESQLRTPHFFCGGVLGLCCEATGRNARELFTWAGAGAENRLRPRAKSGVVGACISGWWRILPHPPSPSPEVEPPKLRGGKQHTSGEGESPLPSPDDSRFVVRRGAGGEVSAHRSQTRHRIEMHRRRSRWSRCKDPLLRIEQHIRRTAERLERDKSASAGDFGRIPKILRFGLPAHLGQAIVSLTIDSWHPGRFCSRAMLFARLWKMLTASSTLRLEPRPWPGALAHDFAPRAYWKVPRACTWGSSI